MAAPKAPLLDANGQEVEGRHARQRPSSRAEVKPHLVHEAVRAELNARRAGTFATKSRGLVSGGRSKPWRQKGTGRARAGTIRAAQFTGGGHAFAKVPRTFVQKVNRKAAKAALRSRAREPRRARLACAARRAELRRALDEARESVLGRRRSRLPSWSSSSRARKLPRNRSATCLGSQSSPRRSSRSPPSSGRARCWSRSRRCRSFRRGPRSARRPDRARARRLGEELRGHRRRHLHLQGAPGRAQDADPPGRRGALRGQGRAGSTSSRCRRSPSAAA